MIVFTNTVTPRLHYILDFLGQQTVGRPLAVTEDAESFRGFNGPKINYSTNKITDSEFQIHNSHLLFETGIRTQPIECFETNGYKAFFKTKGDFSFDIFAASFYLLSRYEEYLPHTKDAYERYDHQNSLAFREGFLRLPLINIWIQDFKKRLKHKFPSLLTHESAFTFIPTYDIDEAYSYKFKQWWRTAGGLIKSVTNARWSAVRERINVLRGMERDPYDSFEWMDQLHQEKNLHPHYFFLVANTTGKYDKHILPSKRVMERLIAEHCKRYSIGIHPSWQSGNDENKLRNEILQLGHICGKPIVDSRQHYIRFTLPRTFRRLIDIGIQSDFSMGYGSINGFRASVASPFYWYDVEKEKQTNLLLYPFCYMDANSFFEQKFSTEQAFEEMMHYYDVVKSVNGILVTIWHNSFLGTDKRFQGWREIYLRFIEKISQSSV